MRLFDAIQMRTRRVPGGLAVGPASLCLAVAAGGGLSAVNEVLAEANLGGWPTLFIILAIAFLAGFMLDRLVTS